MTEHQIQCLIIEWASYQKHPAFDYLFAIPNGGTRNIITAVSLKKEGVKRGVPDLFLAYPSQHYSGLFLELKKDFKAKASKYQEQWIEKLNEVNYLAMIGHGFDESINIISDYLAIEIV